MKRLRTSAFTVVTALVLLATAGLVKQPESPAQGNRMLPLQAPPFVSVAYAAEDSILSVIADEAGIAAYFGPTSPPDMESVKDAFRTIEKETPEYIIGSVEVANYPESEDVHAYVHADGWFLAYYLAADPAAKIFDWRDYFSSGHTELTTKLDQTLEKLASYAVVSYSDCTYYDFRHPDSTHLMLVADWVYNGADTFEVYLPGDFVVEERSWSLGTDDDAYYKLNGETLANVNCDGWCTRQGFIAWEDMRPNLYHTIEVWGGYPDHGYGGLALVYQVPQ